MNKADKEMTLIAPEESFFWGGRGKLVSTSTFTGPKRPCITGLELRSVERNKPDENLLNRSPR